MRAAARWTCSATFIESEADLYRSLEADLVLTLKLQHLARLVGGRDRKRELFEDTADLLHLMRVRLRELAAPEIEAVLQSDTHISTHLCADREEPHLMT